MRQWEQSGQLAGFVIWAILILASGPVLAADFDLLLKGGRVIDPETGLDAVRDVAIVDGRIAAVGTGLGEATETLDVRGLVVAPGFIDLHSHGAFSQANHIYALHDGVTTVLDLEAGAHPVSAPRTQVAGNATVNFGSSAGYLSARLLVKDGIIRPHISTDTGISGLKGAWGAIRYYLGFDLQATHSQASDEEISAVLQLLEQDLADGAVGIGFLLDYMSEAISPHEVERVFEFAAKRGQMIFVHIRQPEEQGNPSGLLEVIEAAERTGASVHVCHLGSAAINAGDKFIALLKSAQARGVDITTEVYPYLAGSTAIGANIFGRDWQKAFGMTYSDIEHPVTGERLTEASFSDLRKSDPGAMIILHYSHEEWMQPILADDGVIVASDAMPMEGLSTRVHPRTVGTFSRVLGRYVRDQGLFSLPMAIRKMSLLPAKRLESMVPDMRKKGRIQEGADADIVVFDAATVIDAGTYADPHQFSKGIKHVLIGGQLALRDGEQVHQVMNGRFVASGRSSKSEF